MPAPSTRISRNFVTQCNLATTSAAVSPQTPEIDFFSFFLFSFFAFLIHYSGYLPPKEVVNLSLAYSTVYHLGFDQGLIISAINNARSMDIRHGLVNIDKFTQYVTENHE